MNHPEPIRRLLGRVAYVPTWEAMRDFTLQRGPESSDELWLVEHEPVYTLGQAGRREHLIDPGATPIVATDRGGQVTYHGPGQAVVYTLIDLRRLGITVRTLVFRIEEAVIQMLEPLGVIAQRVRGAPGVYVRYRGGSVGRNSTSTATFADLAKIAALGVRIRKGCSYHGVALNVAMDLAPFQGIDPCGYAGLAVVDLATLGVNLSWSEAAGRLSDRLAAHLIP
ncbi:MAG: lipoyl(octanoyl) transferase LipB [Burkholderiaceae bacterium]|nr:lipoyl(octanoyl) transferase LipB [Burkholderiaceae bacterium]